MSLATLQGELEEVYSRREGMKIVSREIVDVPVTVLARDESSGATIYGGDFGGLSSPRQKKEMDEMMKKKEEDREMGVGEDMGSVEEVEKNNRCITRETAKGNGTTTKRKPSTGDLLYTPKGE